MSDAIVSEDAEAQHFYCQVLKILTRGGIRFMVGGSFAASNYTGRPPHTKDLDIFLPPSQVDGALHALERAGFETERTFPFWIAKAWKDDYFVDLISRASSGIWEIEEGWLDRTVEGDFWGARAPIIGAEELIWTKAAIMDRGRFDGNDVMHLLQARAHELDWDRLYQLFGHHWRLLLAHLTLFGYVYEDLIPLVPKHLMAELSLRLMSERPEYDDTAPLCRGTLISNSQYLLDVEELGYKDARVEPQGPLRAEDLRPWNEAVKRGDT